MARLIAMLGPPRRRWSTRKKSARVIAGGRFPYSLGGCRWKIARSAVINPNKLGYNGYNGYNCGCIIQLFVELHLQV